MEKFNAFVVEELENNTFVRSIKQLSIDDLPAGDVIIKVAYSSLNYKDFLSAYGNKGITKKYPHTPGIDSVGEIVESKSDKFKPGDKVICTGYDFGMNTHGGYSEYVRVPAEWPVLLPEGMNLKDSMIYGTAGFTAAIGVNEILKAGIKPGMGRVLVSGATGGVGSMALAFLAKLGFNVIASSGKESEYEYLKQIGAEEIVSREDLQDTTNKPLLKKRWIAAFDTVGGQTLSTIIRATADRGIVTNCGMIKSTTLDVSIFPFILRGVRLVGIAAADTPYTERLEIWNKIAKELKPDVLDIMYKEIQLSELSNEMALMKEGKVRRKILVKI